MKNLLSFFGIIILSVLAGKNFAQSSFKTKEFIDINNIRAAALLHGDLWWDGDSGIALCEFPKGSGKNIGFVSTVWISALDGGNNVHVAGQTLREVYSNGNDYWPGPLDNNGDLNYATSSDWNKIWKVNKTEIDAFRALSSHTVSNTPQSILVWPAKGNVYAKGYNGNSISVSSEMAPYKDVNSDGKYNPLDGDYPDIKGDQALWWVFSDNGPTHNESGGQPLKFEIHALNYAFTRGTLIDNVVYYEYTIVNKSSNNYKNCRVGVWTDAQLGYFFDDYIGFDSARRMGISYNATSIDGTGQTWAYGASPPMMGITLLEIPGDNSPNYLPAGSFIYHINNAGINGIPNVDTQFHNYLRAKLRNGTHFTNDFTGPGNPSLAYGSGPDVNYVFPGDISDMNQWSECAAGNFAGDRHFVLASNDFSINKNATAKFVFALVVTDTGGYACPGNFNAIREVADTAWKVYKTVSIPRTPEVSNLKIYPNPATDKLFIDGIGARDAELNVYNSMGQNVSVMQTNSGNRVELNTSHLTQGLYYIMYRKGGDRGRAVFVKE